MPDETDGWVIVLDCTPPLPGLVTSGIYATKEEAESAAVAAAATKPILIGKLRVALRREMESVPDTEALRTTLAFIVDKYTLILPYGGIAGLALAGGSDEGKKP